MHIIRPTPASRQNANGVIQYDMDFCRKAHPLECICTVTNNGPQGDSFHASNLVGKCVSGTVLLTAPALRNSTSALPTFHHRIQVMNRPQMQMQFSCSSPLWNAATAGCMLQALQAARLPKGIQHSEPLHNKTRQKGQSNPCNRMPSFHRIEAIPILYKMSCFTFIHTVFKILENTM